MVRNAVTPRGALCRAGLLAAAMSAGAVGTTRAQQGPVGSVSVSVRIHFPDSMRIGAMAGDTFALRMRFASDGNRYAVEFTPGPIAAMPTLDGIRAWAIFDPATDSLHGAALMPAGMTQGAGPSGYRFDFGLQGLHGLQNRLTDSLQRLVNPAQTFRDLGTTSEMAGMRCENWVESSPNDTLRMCVIPTPPELERLTSGLRHQLGLDSLLQRLSGGTAPFGGRHMTPLMIEESKGMMRMEVTSISSAPPDSSLFTIPPGLIPFQMPTIRPDSGGR